MRPWIVAFLLPVAVYVSRAQSAEYPVISEAGHTIKEFIPDGWHLFDSTSGNLNKDKLRDVAFVIEADTTAIEHESEDKENVEAWEGPPRILIVLFKQKKGGYRRSVQANTFVLRAHEGGSLGDPWTGMSVERGSLNFHFYGGNWWRWGLDYRFRFQDGGWYLIGAANLSYHSGSGEMESYEYNLLTGDVEITKGNAFGEECRPCEDCGTCDHCERCGECERCVRADDEVINEKIGKKPLRKLEDFVPWNWEIMPGQFI